MLRNATTSIATLQHLTPRSWCDAQSSRLISTNSRQPQQRQSSKPPFKFPSPPSLPEKDGRRNEELYPSPSMRESYACRGKEEHEPPKRLLTPYELSRRLQRLCDEGRIDEAVEMLKTAPCDVHTPPVWNTVIKEVLKAHRWNLAYLLYIDMKRRGVIPSLRTYTTMFAGYSLIKDWKDHTKQLEHVHKLYENFQQRTQTLQKSDPDDPELGVAPTAAYLRTLASAGLYQKMFDVYYDMDQEGPLSPNQYIFTALFQGICKRKMVTPVSGEEIVDVAEVHAQNASDVKLLWRQMVKVADKNPRFQFDSHLLTFALYALAQGRPTDHIFAFDILRDWLGLTKPGEEAPPKTVPLSHQMFSAALWLCNMTQKHRLTIHFFSQVVDRIAAGKQESIINSKHIEDVLRSYAALCAMGSMTESQQALSTLEWMLRGHALRKDDELQPRLETFILVLIACWRGLDWNGEVRTFELMSGYSGEDFRHEITPGTKPEMAARSRGLNLQPDTAAMSYMARTALATQDPENARQCLRIIEHIGLEHLLEKTYSSFTASPKDLAFYQAKLAHAVVDLVNATSNAPDHTAEDVRWRKMKDEAMKAVRSNTGPQRVPSLEDEPLGSLRGLAATDSVVAQRFLARGV